MKSLADCLTASNLSGIEQQALLAASDKIRAKKLKGVSVSSADVIEGIEHKADLSVVKKALKSAENELVSIEKQIDETLGIKAKEEKPTIPPKPKKPAKPTPKPPVAPTQPKEKPTHAKARVKGVVRPFAHYRRLIGKRKGQIEIVFGKGAYAKRAVVEAESVKDLDSAVQVK
ncbi:MAG: hypothetical protein SWO11_21845, partial [Thermodesulfobacteriota bacterium]|nr:hypothetical protein [Thermodesulfobacteriota bacterium]